MSSLSTQETQKEIAERTPALKRAVQSQIEPLSVTVRRASELTGIGQTKLWEMIGAGVIESVKIAGRRLLLYESLKKLVAQVQPPA
jgi:excisionase family DNA binding protein